MNSFKLKTASLLTLMALAFGGCSKPPELHIYTWSDYIAPEVLAKFEAANGCKIVIDTFDSNEAMYAKLKAGGTGYDLITPSSYQVAMMAKEDMIEKIDHSKCPNVKKNFDTRFVKQVLDPEFTYNVPYCVTYTGLAYAKDKVPEGADINSWTILDNTAFKGRISLLDDIREVIGAGLMACGYSINSTNAEEIDAAVKKVLGWRQNVRKFDGESYKTEVPAGSTWIGHGYSSDVNQVIIGEDEDSARDDIGFALPKEGFSVAFDEFVIAKGAAQADLAYKFIDFIYDGDIAAENMDYICAPNPVKPGIDQLDEGLAKVIILSEDQLKVGQVICSLDDATMELYNKAWDRIKATEAR